MGMSTEEYHSRENCFICLRQENGLLKILKGYEYTIYNILENLYGEQKLKDKAICNRCILKIKQYDKLEKINNKLEEIYMSID